MEQRIKNHTVNDQDDNDSGVESRNRPEMVTCDAPTPKTRNIMQPYSRKSGISRITLTPQTYWVKCNILEVSMVTSWMRNKC